MILTRGILRKAGFINRPVIIFINDNFLMGNCKMITQKELKELLHYNPESGIFTRKISTSSKAMKGYSAGTLNKVSGYIQISINYKIYKAHRLVWLYVYGVWPKDEMDHINHIRDDNRIVNLREVNNQENHKNMSVNVSNTSGITGVVWNKKREMWQSQIKINYKCIFLGCHLDKFEAICARKSADNKHGFHENHGVNLK